MGRHVDGLEVGTNINHKVGRIIARMERILSLSKKPQDC